MQKNSPLFGIFYFNNQGILKKQGRDNKKPCFLTTNSIQFSFFQQKSRNVEMSFIFYFNNFHTNYVQKKKNNKKGVKRTGFLNVFYLLF